VRDEGYLCLQLGRRGEALDALRAYLAARPDAEDADLVREAMEG